MAALPLVLVLTGRLVDTVASLAGAVFMQQTMGPEEVELAEK